MGQFLQDLFVSWSNNQQIGFNAIYRFAWSSQFWYESVPALKDMTRYVFMSRGSPANISYQLESDFFLFQPELHSISMRSKPAIPSQIGRGGYDDGISY